MPRVFRAAPRGSCEWLEARCCCPSWSCHAHAPPCPVTLSHPWDLGWILPGCRVQIFPSQSCRLGDKTQLNWSCRKQSLTLVGGWASHSVDSSNKQKTSSSYKASAACSPVVSGLGDAGATNLPAELCWCGRVHAVPAAVPLVDPVAGCLGQGLAAGLPEHLAVSPGPSV